MVRDQFIPEQTDKKHVDDLMDKFLDKLLEACPPLPLPMPQVLTDKQALAALSTGATLIFAESKPCWMEESDGVKARAAAVSDSR
jgi:hypothetical protein